MACIYDPGTRRQGQVEPRDSPAFSLDEATSSPLSKRFHLNKIRWRASKMAQLVKELATKPENLSSIPRTHLVEKEKKLPLPPPPPSRFRLQPLI